MKFFIDTAKIEEIKEAAALGILDGIAVGFSQRIKCGSYISINIRALATLSK